MGEQLPPRAEVHALPENNAVTVRLFYRCEGLGVSHERLYSAVTAALPRDIHIDSWTAPSASLGLVSLIRNLASAYRARADVNHVTAGVLSYLVWVLPADRTIVTIHDCASLKRLRGWRRTAWLWFWHKLPLGRVAQVVAVSEATRAELEEFVPELRQRITVVENCVSEVFQEYPRKFNQSCPTILQVGTKPNKNLLRVAEALNGFKCHLRIVGALTPQQSQVLAANAINFSNVSGISDAEIAEEYSRCDVVIFASTYEGFGMPIVEAQRVGRPVIVSNLEPMSSVAGAGAMFVDPFDSMSIRRALEQLVRSAEARESVVTAGLRNASRFAASTVAERYATLYRRLCTGGRSDPPRP
jgi:glycosyltransferase involved in cell wall biosynthesis